MFRELAVLSFSGDRHYIKTYFAFYESPEDGNRTNSRNVVYIKYSSDNGKYLTYVSCNNYTSRRTSFILTGTNEKRRTE
jgi:hypothetical protein